MALQEEGWPLGLRLFNERIGLARNGDFSGSVSFSTMLTASPTRSTDSSSDLDTQAMSVNVAPSLGHYLVAERRAASTHRRNNQCSTIYGPNDFSQVQESNSLFVGGQGAAHSSSTSLGEDCGRESNKALEQSNEYAAPIICCLCR
ncbi:hypothetical protein glysoja_046518 [Glycine soja]|uniref:Uncharacterized protein n=1 Tax=Glycine soja TaxID=3848 RepID=A0A0B2RXH0_GLYSO|nr:hypothetical protein glysoja_046518 [Glycine soja]